MPEVSVIIPCYNLGAYLDEAVDSVLGQTYTDYEIIIVNDGSTDPETLARLEVQEAKPKCRVLSTANQGLPATRNYGITASSGRFISCLDADDRFHPHFLRECVARLVKDTDHELGFVTCTAKVFGCTNAYWKCSDYDPVRLMVENVIHVASMFRRQCWEEVGGYALNLSGFQDWNFWLSIVARGYRWTTIKRPLFLYRDRAGSMIEGSEKKRRVLKRTIVENNLAFFQEHVLDVLDEYERVILELKADVRDNELAVARTSLEKLQNLYSAHQKVKQEHETLVKTFRAGRR